MDAFFSSACLSWFFGRIIYYTFHTYKFSSFLRQEKNKIINFFFKTFSLLEKRQRTKVEFLKAMLIM